MKIFIPILFTKNNLVQFQKAFIQFDEKAVIISRNGFVFFLSKRFKGSRVIQCPGSQFHLQNFDQCVEKIAKRFTDPTQPLDENVHCGEILAQEYKIHLMPKSQYILPVLIRLVDAIASDEKLCALIRNFKVQINPGQRSIHNQVLPVVVIYPGLGKETASILVKYLKALYAEYNLEQVCMHTIPRYNKSVNKLIYYSQSGGDIKNNFSEFERSIFLSGSQVHFNWGEPKLVRSQSDPEITNEEDKEDKRDKSDKKNIVPTKVVTTPTLDLRNKLWTKRKLLFSLGPNVPIPASLLPSVPASQPVALGADDINKEATLLNILHVMLLNIIQKNLHSPTIEANPGTVLTPKPHLRFWYSDPFNNSIFFKALVDSFTEFNIPISFKTKPRKGAFIAIHLPSDAEFILDSTFAPAFKAFFHRKLQTLEASEPLFKKQKTTHSKIL